MIDPRYVTELLANTIKKYRNPLPKDTINVWWKGFVREEGEWLFFTGMLYQITPYIDLTVKFLEKLEESRLQKFIRLSKYLPLGLIRFRPRAETDDILRSVYFLLEKAEIDVYYKPELDYYSGILLYDLGDDDTFEEHANFVVDMLENAEVENVVTVDPHTTYALKVLYPRYTGKRFKIKSYIELLEGKFSWESGEIVRVHDPCYYGRYLEISDVLRNLLDDLGVIYEDVRNSKKYTACCGGPIEAVSPLISKEIAKLRLEELGRGRVITACPICMANLRRVGGNVEDLATLLRRCVCSQYNLQY